MMYDVRMMYDGVYTVFESKGTEKKQPGESS